MITAVICNFLGKDLKDDEVYQDRLAKGLITMRGENANLRSNLMQNALSQFSLSRF